LLWLDPAITRAQIVLHAGHQFVEGDVLHWWHPPASKGIRTRFADDLLWLPLIASEYVRATGDATVLDEVTRYLRAEPLAGGEDEVFVEPEESGERGSIYEHCCRAIDRSLAVGAHGLPLMGTGDWNDGMNRVGREGRGESVWMGFFLFDILQRFIPLVEARQEGGRARRYRAHAATLQEALNDGGWDGGWYRRAYYDSGAPLGAASNDECRIDTIAQAWAVLSGAAPPARAEQALDALEEHLVSEADGIIRLLTPAFDRTPHDPGYIKGYLPGVRENGGQYTHGALWAVRALAEAGRTERAARLLELLSPASHARTPAEVTRYQVEPYVVAADVYGVAPHVGRGGWTWYTGSAGWMYRVALESILGLELRADTLLLRPCIPRTWPGFEITLARPEATYHLEVRRGAHRSGGTIDGVPLEIRNGAVIVPLRAEGGSCRVDVQLGADVGRLYTPRTGR
jgi:cyclic beta-1,2-glucan synthetase